MKSLKISTPGKLFIAGEYAVVKGYHAILCATHVTLDVTIQEAHDFYIHSTKWQQGHVFDMKTLPQYQTIWSNALQTVYTYLEALNMSVRPHHLYIDSQLDQTKYAKWGLGSSGALVVGLIESVCAFHEVTYDAMLIYKLAVLSQYDQQSLASFADMATAAFKSGIVYKKFRIIPQEQSLLNQVHTPWEALDITPITMDSLPIMVIHTGQEASSLSLVKHFIDNTDVDTVSKVCLDIEGLTIELIDTIKQNKPFEHVFHDMMEAYQQLPNKVFKDIVNLPIRKLLALEDVKPYAKFSGAGGGDNIIVYIKDLTHYQRIKKQLKQEHTIISHLIKGVNRYE
jgi:phosphomevalonate kinase